MGEFADEINKIKQENKLLGPQTDAIVLYGSSTFTIWKHEDIKRDLSDYMIINRGFGGSHADIALAYLNQALLPIKPKALFYFEGANDIALGQSPHESLSNTMSIYRQLKEQNPQIIWIFLLLHLCPGRQEYHGQFQFLNDLYVGFCMENENCHTVDPNVFVLDDNGKIDRSLYLEDGIHFNDRGYVELGALVKVRFKEIFAD